MTTLTHRHGPYCDLVESLGLDHDTPVFEWHEWLPTPPPPLPDPALPLHSGGTATNTITVAVPPGSEFGALIIIAASTYGAGNTVVCSDPRVDLIASDDPSFRVFAGHLVTGDGKDWNDPFTITTAGTSLTADLAVYEPGVTFGTVSPYAADADKALPAPTLHDVAAVAVIARSWEFLIAGTTISAPAGYSTVGTASSTKTRTKIYHWSAGGALDDNPGGDFTANGDSGALALYTIEITTDEDAEPVDPYSWQRNDDRTAALVDYSVIAGRPTPAQNTDPLSGSVTLARYLAGTTLPATGDRYRITLNADVSAALEIDEEERPRFTGEITDVEIAAAGDLTLVRVAGLGRRARLTRTPVTTHRPQERDGERVRRILAQVAIALPLDVGTIDPGTVDLLPADPIAVPAEQLLEAARADSLGRLVEHRSGRLDYHDASHRRGLTSRVTLTGADHLIQPFSWRQGVGSIINDASATFGPADDRETVRVTDPTSADPNTGVGPYGASLDTQLASALDAYALLTDLVGRNARPAYYLPSVLVDLCRTAGDTLPVLLQLNHGDKIHAADLPPDGAFTDGDVFVEGTTETATARAWRLQLVVADPALAGAGLRWIDVPRFLRWSDVDPTLTWLDLATVTDPYTLGTPVADGGDADDVTVGLIVNGGNASTTSWDYVLSGALP